MSWQLITALFVTACFLPAVTLRHRVWRLVAAVLAVNASYLHTWTMWTLSGTGGEGEGALAIASMLLLAWPVGMGLFAGGLAGAVDRIYGYKTGGPLANWALIGLTAVFFVAVLGLWLFASR